jgi:hypothetical protein
MTAEASPFGEAAMGRVFPDRGKDPQLGAWADNIADGRRKESE